MEIQIDRTREEHYFQTEYLTREAFWNVYKPGCNEHLILHKIRKSACCVSELDLVAVSENEMIGHIVATKATVIDSLNDEHEVLCVGPVSVLPKYQKCGVGSALMRKSIACAKELGYRGMILFGNPDYYHRFGFRNAKDYGITTKDGQNFEPFMALELQRSGLEHVTGKFIYDAAYETNPEELAEFEKNFPYKEKLKTDTQFE